MALSATQMTSLHWLKRRSRTPHRCRVDGIWLLPFSLAHRIGWSGPIQSLRHFGNALSDRCRSTSCSESCLHRRPAQEKSHRRFRCSSCARPGSRIICCGSVVHNWSAVVELAPGQEPRRCHGDGGSLRQERVGTTPRRDQPWLDPYDPSNTLRAYWCARMGNHEEEALKILKNADPNEFPIPVDSP